MKIYLLLATFFIVGSSLFSQLTSSLEQIKRYGIKNRLDNFDSTKIDFDYRVQGNLHYLLPFYVALLNEEKAIKKNTKVGFYDNASQLISFSGDYFSAIQFAVKGFDSLESSIVSTIASHADEFKDISHTDARKYIIDKAKDQQVIMINEAHCKPLHRVFTLSLLDDLYKLGFRYLAMEALTNHSAQSVQKVDINTGYYLAEPIAAELVRKALKLGYTLIPYEDTTTTHHSGTQRDSAQAANIYNVLQKDPEAKILVHAGYGHISEELIGNDYVPLGMAFKKLSGIDPFTIDQTEMTDGSNFEYGRLFYDQYIKKHPLQYASVAMQKNKLVSPLGNTGYDLTVIHPKTMYKNGRATWYSLNGLRTEVPIQPVERNLFMVQAYYENEYSEKYLGLKIPADQTYITAENGYYYLYLQKGKYKLVYRDINYKVLATKDLDIK
jgi:hypothetical protein